MKRLALLPLLALALAACGNAKHVSKSVLNASCPYHRPAMRIQPKLPDNIPNAAGIRYSGIVTTHGATVASGFVAGPLPQALKAFTSMHAGGFRVTQTRHNGTGSARLSFTAGSGKNGVVELAQACKTRTDVTITLR
jgi:hypothetical protein